MLHKELAKLLQQHRRSVSRFRGYACVCGEPLRSNSMQATSEHQAEIVLKFLKEQEDAS